MSPTPTSPVTLLHKLGASAARHIPLELGEWMARLSAPFAAAWSYERYLIVARHQQRALRWRAHLTEQAQLGEPAQLAEPEQLGELAGNSHHPGLLEVRRSTRAAFESYARYWLESFRLPSLSTEVLDTGFDRPGYAYVKEALDVGKGIILALPHLGGWEWAGFWLTQVRNHPVTAVVEPLEPPDLFEWFADFRRELGMKVVPLGPEAGNEVLGALSRNEIVCLLCDRDLGGDGLEVEFLGERTKLPIGPALLALRTGAPLLPAAVYFKPRGGHLAYALPPLDTERHEKSLRKDVKRVTQALADELGLLIAAAPHQWHMFNPNWPSDIPAE